MDLFKLTDLTAIEKEKYGNVVSNLHKVFTNNISIVETLVISNKLFSNFKLDKTKTKEIALVSETIGKFFSKYNSISISHSLNKEIYGIESFSNIIPNTKNIFESIITIYNSWFEEKAKAFRITYSIIDEDTYPALVIQPYFSNYYSLVSRCPRSGQMTNTNNLIDNINNTIENLNKSHEKLIEKIEDILKKPCKFYFIEQDNQIKIQNVENETMTIEAKWIAINDLYFKGIINKDEYIDYLEPNMIYNNSGIKPIGESNANIITLRGLSASPGISVGILVLSNNDEHAFIDNNAIFCCIEASPEDLKKMSFAIGVIAARGGTTSHSAMFCRGMGKPAVTGAPFKIDFKSKCLIVGDKVINENSYVFVDGNKGLIHFSESPINPEVNYEATVNTEFLTTALKTIKSISSQDNFGELQLDFQLKIAHLLSAFNKIQLTI